MTTARIGTTLADSRPGDPSRPGPPADAPNVVVVILDDLGFAQLGCYGSDIDTPHFDRLAAGGLRYTNFHTTALCSPTRACLLTGRNHHRVGMGFLPDVPMRFPGYTGRIPPEAATLADLLGDAGYATLAVGKWHLVPRGERTPAGPFDQWPLGKGFQRYYGFLGGDANQWTPELVCDNHPVEPPRTPDDGYHVTEDLADRAIEYLTTLRDADPERPFLLWFAPGATHAPHHAPPEWIDRYAGRFDEGWDVWRERAFERQRAAGLVPEHAELAPRPPWVQTWDELDPDEARLYARMQEVFAGFLSHTDHHVGRILDHLEVLGELDDTLVILLADNGASAEGGPHGSVNEMRMIAGLHEDLDENLAKIDQLGGFRSYNHYPWGWAMAGNTPFRRWKRYTWEGGARDPLVVHWPAGMAARGEVRDQYCHVVDLFSTVLDAAGVAVPAQFRGATQMGVDGVSLRPTFDDPDGPELRTTQYYEMWGSRAIYHDGWKAVTDHVNQHHPAERDLTAGSTDFATDHWALFDTRSDPSECHDLSARHPEQLAALVDRWWAEAGRNQVLPLDDGVANRFAVLDLPTAPARTRFTYRAGASVHEEAGPMLAGTDFGIVAALAAPWQPGHAGVLATQGDWTNGWACYVADDRLWWVLNYVGRDEYTVMSRPLPAGTTVLTAAFTRTPPAGGRVVVSADGVVVGEGEIPVDLPFRWRPNGALLTVGFARGFPVCDAYRPPFPFSGALGTVTIELGGVPAPLDPSVEIDTALHHQ